MLTFSVSSFFPYTCAFPAMTSYGKLSALQKGVQWLVRMFGLRVFISSRSKRWNTRGPHRQTETDVVSLPIKSIHLELIPLSVPAGIALTRSWHRRYTSTGVCWEVWRGSRCRRAADTPRRDLRGRRWGPALSGSGRTVAPPAPGADGNLFVWSPAAHSSASCSTEWG